MAELAPTVSPSDRLRSVSLWILKGLLAAVFVFAGVAKLVGHPMMVAEFAKIGLGQGFRLITGLVEIVGAILLLWPRSAFLGALTLLAVCVGAFAAQVGPLQGDLVHVVVLGLLLLPVLWATRPQGLRVQSSGKL